LSDRVISIKKRWVRDHESSAAMLALSAPALGVASLPGATREAQFIATLQAQGELPRQAASFESVEDVGALRLLYHMRDSSELRNFVAEALGELENRDQRGTLKATLRAFLESGGSQVEASNRLGIHRNTLAYRLRRIGELVGRDVMDPQSWLTLHLAMRASQMMRAFSDES
jgi:purine catabolism regulator